MAQDRRQQDQKPISWDTMPTDPTQLPFVCLIEGTQGQGKTHLACTFPHPLFIIDTENRADKVGAKFVSKGVPIYWKRCRDLDTLRRTLTDLIFTQHTSGTIIIDSASELQTYAEAEWLRESKGTKVWPITLWPEVWTKINNIIEGIRARGYHLVFTARRKQEHIDDKATGQLVLEGYKRLPHLADIHLLMDGGQATVLKNGFRNSPSERQEILPNPTYESIRNELILAGAAEGWTYSPPEAPVTAIEGNQGDASGRPQPGPVDEPQRPAPPTTGRRGNNKTRLMAAARKLGMTPKALDEFLASKGKPKVAEMTEEQIAVLADSFEEQYKAKEGQAH